MSASLLTLAWKSLANRGVSVALTILSIVLAVMLFLGVEKIRTGVRASFDSTISDTDLIVGARGGAINLLLYSVFRLGDPTANIGWDTYQLIASAPDVDWTVPISLGDSHRGYRVVGTTQAYFDHYRYGRRQPLALSDGRIFDTTHEVVLGAEVARQLDYGLGGFMPSMPAMISRLSAFSRPPARPWTGLSMSRWRVSRRSMSAGRAARRRPGALCTKRLPPIRSSPTASRPSWSG
jgi:hypothetical protein